jgi:hypothetical protein
MHGADDGRLLSKWTLIPLVKDSCFYFFERLENDFEYCFTTRVFCPTYRGATHPKSPERCRDLCKNDNSSLETQFILSV